MKSAFWLFIGLFLGLGLSYVAYLKAENRHLAPQAVAADDEVEGMRQAADRLAQRQRPAADQQAQELKSPFGRYLMDLFDSVQGGTEEERRIVRDSLRENDELLHEVLEEDLQAKIRAANNPRQGVPAAPVRRQPRNFVERFDNAKATTPQQDESQPTTSIDPKDAI